MTDVPTLKVSNDVLREHDDHGALMAKVHENLVNSLVQRDNDEMTRLLKGTWPEPEQEDVGLFQQAPASFRDNEPLSKEAVRKQLQEKFADKLGTRTHESEEIMARAFPVGDAEKETVIVPRKNGKKPTGIDPTGPMARAMAATPQRTMVASSHTHGMGTMQSTTQVAALNISGRDVEECLRCGALVLEQYKHQQFHEKADDELAEAQREIARLKTKRVPRPTKTDKKLVKIQDGMVVGNYVLKHRLMFPGNAAKSTFVMENKYTGDRVELSAQEFVTHCAQHGKTVDLNTPQPTLREQTKKNLQNMTPEQARANMSMTYEEAVEGGIVRPMRQENMSVEDDPKLAGGWNERMGVID